jgi:hypothetical protein
MAGPLTPVAVPVGRPPEKVMVERVPVVRLMGELGAGQDVEGDRGGVPGSGAVVVPDGHGAVGVAERQQHTTTHG